MKILLIALLFVLNMLGTHGHHCEWHEVGCLWDQLFVISEPVENCHCVRTHQCYQEDISKHRICRNTFSNAVNPNYVCCRNPVWRTTVKPPPRRPTTFTTQRPSFLDGGPNKRPGGPNKRPGGPNKRPGGSNKRPGGPNKSPGGPNKRPSQRPEATTKDTHKISTLIPITNPPSQIRPSSSQSQDTSQASPPTNNDCNCMPLSDCLDEDFESNSQHKKQGSCPNSSDVCCFGLVKPVTSAQLPPQSPSSISTQGQTLGSSPRPPLPSPTQASPPGDKTCTCTPFYKCYDEETSSNLTSLVNDRLAVPSTDESCSDPNDVCCYNLVKITAKPVDSSEECIGSCVFIKECPYFVNKFNEAQKGNQDAVQELRKSVCSRTNGSLYVCCPQEPKNRHKTSGVIFPDK